MIGIILQLSGALMLGYEIALRGRKQSVLDAICSGGTFAKPTRETAENYASYHQLYTTYAYRIGFLFIISGYILPLLFDQYFEQSSVNANAKAFLVIFISTSLLIASVNVSKILALNAFEKEEINNKEF